MCTHALSFSLWQGAAALHVFQNVADKLALDRILTSHVCVSYAQPAMKGIYNIFIFYFYQYFSFSQIWDSEMESHLSLFLSWWHSNVFLFSHAIESNMYYYSGDEEERTNKLKLIKKQTRTGCYTQILKIAGFFQGFQTWKIILNFLVCQEELILLRTLNFWAGRNVLHITFEKKKKG